MEVERRVTLERCKEAGLAHTGWTANGHTNQCIPHKLVTLDESEVPISLETHAHTLALAETKSPIKRSSILQETPEELLADKAT